MICKMDVRMEKSWGYCKNKTESQRQEAQVQNEDTRKLLIPGNINRQELIQKPPYLHQNQAPPKSQVPEQDIPR